MKGKQLAFILHFVSQNLHSFISWFINQSIYVQNDALECYKLTGG